MKKRLLLGAVAAVLLGSAQAANVPPSASMQIEFELPKLEVADYARPYVAIWVEDSGGKTVRNIALWTGKDTEWLKDIRRWWRKFGRYQGDGIDAYSSATRPAGQYQVQWDAKDGEGNPVTSGDYTLYVEVVREHGGRDLVRQPIQLGQQEFSMSSKAKYEIGSVTLSYKI
ncbi:DUF2271 domain-containing protein [Paraferrimonas sedimenticola]|uniref:DUF2271 domain-containing protein n=1 Tax=Paraferrimonas sedimenticola TaxID=375674 RepID=A0AA37W0M2_9GAMM|nr:DUF2271 domain-containing protein [Paraferrimonas sedimenticola]GLP95593.1 hypothetical protein GCM10007895_08990 [Paraferrimonas sedimenticola]